MDCESAGNAAGIDPKVLVNWQTDAAFSVAPWGQHHSGFDQSPEWDTSQDSSPSADPLDPVSLQNSDHHDIPLLDRSSDFLSADFSNQGTSSPDKFNPLADGPVEGTISGTISPRTLPSSSDDNLESWPQYQLFSSLPSAMLAEAPFVYPYGKEHQNTSTDPVVVEDVGELAHGQVFADVPSDQIMSFQHMPQSLHQFVTDPWADATATATATAENVAPAQQEPVPVSTESQLETKEIQSMRDFQNALRSLEWRWLDGLETQLPINPTAAATFPAIPPDLGFHRDCENGQDRTRFKSENSSVSGDVSGVHDYPYFGASGDVPPTFTERQLGQNDSQYLKWKNTSQVDGPSEVPRAAANATSFIIEAPSESLRTSLPSRPRSISSTVRRASAGHMSLGLQSMATVRKRKQRNSMVSLEQPQQPKPLQIVQEDGQGGSIASADFVSPPRGARRKGPLTSIGRANAGLRRKNKDTCVQCRLNKRKCDGNSPCDACRPTLHEQPCARACFANIVEFGTCNYISQRAINHPTTDGSRRVRIEIPSAFDLNDLLSFLSERQGRFNIRATQAWGSLYVLDLGETYKFLKSLSEYNGNGRSTFIDFIDRRLVESKDKSKNWLSCLRDCDPMNHAYALLSQWNNMPSRAKYSFVSLEQGAEERPMDINNPDDRRDILLAAQLSRIFCRMLEVEGFRKLERDFYNIKWKQISHEAHVRFLSELGHILLTLRWRVSWWKRLGDGGHDPDPSKQHYVDRVELLCRILYVYYTCVLAKLPSWCTSDVPKGVWSTYADAENPVWDDFPLNSTDSGFQKWMARGRDLIEQAGVPNRVSKI